MSSNTLEKLQARFNPEAAKGMDEVFQFHFTDAGSHYLNIQDGTLDAQEGEHDDPSVSLTMSTETLKGIMSGDINGMTAFMTGKLKATGNVMLATKLTTLFPSK
ncbi:SCP2 sterol-binding domain-containing protein [Halomonas sp. GFAJ-1]|uniref:SCP2 sterol-binding domain-containing protein n=1 Tax=Halomonas sp. GFAJ-1 TaxID=1118153 RepID=UPI00023A338C|nr:SCP2 sterol-binding domain-containing protein [Halomonas sp. GFAJ-1]AVI63521.1 SCP-2 family sterol carrier protein [Halomonas sp. GFAJ-1]EHK61507.1 sterol-binding protein [Halomonas sp. GFAJ-1]